MPDKQKTMWVTDEEWEKLLHISQFTAHPGSFTNTVRFLMDTFVEPESGENMDSKHKWKKKEKRSVFCSVRLSPANFEKLKRLSVLAGAPGDLSKTLRWLIETMPEPAELAKITEEK